MLKIVLISPVVGEADMDIDSLQSSCASRMELEEVTLSQGPTDIETERDSAAAALGVVDRALEAEARGADAIVINCMADPGLFATREAVSIPVVGGGEAAIQWAYMLGGKIGWIDVAPNARATVQRQFDICGLSSRYVAFSSITIPPTSLKSSRVEVIERLVASAIQMIEQQGVNIIILGCTLLTDLQEELLTQLKVSHGVVTENIRIIAGLPLAVDTAALLAQAKLRHF